MKENLTGATNQTTSRKYNLYLILSLVIGTLYIYHNPATWKALSYNFYAFFLVAKPYTYYAHVLEFLCITVLWAIGHAMGSAFLRLIRIEKEPKFTLTIPLGWGILSFLVFALALIQLLNPTAIALLFILCAAVCGPISWKNRANRTDTPSWKERFSSADWDVRFSLALLLVPLGVAFFCSLMPPTQSDGLRYHLTVPKLYLRHGGFYLIPDIAFSNFPFLMEYLYAIPLAFGLDSVPKMIHASYYLLCVRLIYEMGKGMGNRRIGAFGAVLFASVPFVPIFASWSFIEMGLTLYTLLTFSLCVDIAHNEDKANAIQSTVLAGLMGGFLLSCKYTALATIFLYFLIIAWPRPSFSFKNFSRSFAHGCLFSAVVGAVACPWFIKNALLLGNPVYPFANGLFQAPYWTEFNALFFKFHAGTKGSFNALTQSPFWDWIVDAVTLPFRATFFSGDKPWHPEDFGHWQIGPQWLTLTPFLLLYRRWSHKKVLHLITGIFLYLTWAYTYRDSRFLLPAMAVGAPLLAALVDEIVTMRSWARWCFYGGVFYCMLFTLSVSLLPRTNAPWWVVSGTVSRDDYLEYGCDFTRNESQAFRWLKKNTEPDEKVLLHGIEYAFYCPNDYVGADWFNTDPLIARSWETPNATGLIQKLQEENIRYLIYYYGKVTYKHHFDLYRYFRLPPDKGYALLKEFRDKEYTRLHYELAYKEWWYRFAAKMQQEEESSPNVKALEELLSGKTLKEEFRFPPKEEENPDPGDKVPDGIVIYKIPEKGGA